jgi:serine/threonine protein kinase
MALSPGIRLGVYEVSAKTGEGGMGEVYRAPDTKLDRDVALKVLPEAFTPDPDPATVGLLACWECAKIRSTWPTHRR